MLWLCWGLLLVSSCIIAYQDFKTRMISVWLIVCFGVANTGQYLILNSLTELIENTVFCLVYFLFSYLILHLFYYIKTRKFQKILDDKIGWGDIWLLLLTGSCIAPVNMIYFFTVTFIAAVLIQFLVLKNTRTIALGAILVISYCFFLIYLTLPFFRL